MTISVLHNVSVNGCPIEEPDALLAWARQRMAALAYDYDQADEWLLVYSLIDLYDEAMGLI